MVAQRSAERRPSAPRLGAAPPWSGTRWPSRPGGAGDVLDIGGGTGGFAVRVAELGHRVTVVDPSPDALAALDRRAREVGVESPATRATCPSCSTSSGRTAPTWCSATGVLEVVDAGGRWPRSARCCGPAAPLSLLVAQRHAAVVARAMAGHLRQALALLDGTSRPSAPAGRRPPRFTADELAGSLVEQAGFAVVRRARRPGLHRPGPGLAARPGARRCGSPGRPGACGRRATGVPPARDPDPPAG